MKFLVYVLVGFVNREYFAKVRTRNISLEVCKFEKDHFLFRASTFSILLILYSYSDCFALKNTCHHFCVASQVKGAIAPVKSYFES
jgi:hypothetical protein